MQTTIPLTRDLVLIGGGHTHALVLRMWGMKPLAGVRVTVINPAPTAPYSGMLPGFVAGHYSKDELDIDLIKLARFAGARIITGKASAIDTKAKTITVGDRKVAYDVASIDVGITSEMPDMEGFADHAVPAKPLDRFAERWDSYRKTASRPRVAVIGGGVAGAELAMAMAHALRHKDHRVTLIDSGKVLSQFGDDARKNLLEALETNGVELVEDAKVDRITSDAVLLEGGTPIPADFVCGAAGARPHAWLKKTGLTLYDGFISVGPTLQSSDSHIFAVGDCCYMRHAPRPKAGVFAVRSAKTLFHNLKAELSGEPLKGYQPQKDYLKLVSLGGQSALAEKLGQSFKGPLLWKWKNHIDTKFMRKFSDLPQMGLAKLPSQVATGVREELGDAPLCGGCGAKVGRSALKEALADLPQNDRADIQSVKGDDAAIMDVNGQKQVMTTDHLRAFTEDPVLMTRIAAIHALGDVWGMGAKPSAATVQIILPRMSDALQRRTMAEITGAAADVLGQTGAAIVGGHSSIGSELTIGFTITGICDHPVTLEGAQAGDAIIITQPIGAGVVMAGEMRGLAKGRDVVATYDAMLQTQAEASRILAPNAHAMTDITGFGLAGHLANICEASGLGAQITLKDVPTLAGAEELSEQGVRSTIWAENRGGAGAIYGNRSPKFDLLFDPQTAGGLMAVVPAEKAEELRELLLLSGYKAAIIGRMTKADGITVS